MTQPDNVVPLNPFADLWRLGYERLVPIVPPSAPLSARSNLYRRQQAGDDARGKAPGVRWPDGNWSGFDWIDYEADEHDLRRWNAMGAGVGIRTGDGLVLIDADTLDENLARVILETIERDLGRLPIRVGRYPKAGYLVRVSGAFKYARVEFGSRDDKGRLRERVEILSDGRQFVAHGVHPGTKAPYRWTRGLPPFSELPVVEPARLESLLATLAGLLPSAAPVVREGATTKVDQASLRGLRHVVTSAVNLTPNTSAAFPTREAYRDYGYAIRAASVEWEDDGLDLFLSWCARWVEGSNDPEIARADWDRMKGPYRRGAPWLFEMAETATGGSFSRASALALGWFDELADEPLGPFEERARIEAAAAPGNSKTPLVFTSFLSAAEGALGDATRPLIKGLLDCGAMTVLYGESNSGKTFVALDMAYCVASGAAYGGMATTRGRVVYVAAEGGRGVRKRALALLKKYGSAGVGEHFDFLFSPINLLSADADLPRLLAALRALGHGLGLVVIDTLSRAMAGGDENSSTDMGAMVTHLDAIRAATGAHVMAVHHTGKDRAKGARGHSLLRAATDTEIEIADLSITVTKQRDLDRAWSSSFALDVVRLGADTQGDAVTSCTVRLVSPDEVAEIVGEAVGKESDVVRAIEAVQMASDKPDDGARIPDIMSALGPDAGVSAVALRQYLSRLAVKNIVKSVKRGVYRLKVCDSHKLSQVENDVMS